MIEGIGREHFWEEYALAREIVVKLKICRNITDGLLMKEESVKLNLPTVAEKRSKEVARYAGKALQRHL